MAFVAQHQKNGSKTAPFEILHLHLFQLLDFLCKRLLGPRKLSTGTWTAAGRNCPGGVAIGGTGRCNSPHPAWVSSFNAWAKLNKLNASYHKYGQQRC